MKKWKKLATFLLVFVLGLSLLSSCGSDTVSTPTPGGNDTPSTTPGTNKLKVAMVTPQKLGDNGPIDACYAGMVDAAEDFGYEYKLLEPEAGEYEDALRSMADDGYQLIFCIFSAVQDALTRVAPDYPNVKFVQILGDVDMDNVRTLNFKDQDGAYLCGIVAAEVSQTKKVAVIAGAEVADNLRCIAGFEAGAKAANPNIQTNHMFVGSFEDPTKGKELANVLLDDGYDVIYEVCASSSMGVREAIREHGEGAYMVGNVVDESEAIPGQVPCSNSTNYYVWFYHTMKEFSKGVFEAGIYSQGLSDSAVDIIFANDDVFPIAQEVKDAVDVARTKIINGTIVPPTTVD